MTRRRITIPGSVLVIALAGLAGILSNAEVRADTINAYLWVNPGGGYDYMTCGWHGSCKPGEETAGVALDFRNYGGDWVYFRGFGERATGGAGNVGTGQPVDSTNGCYRVRVHIEDPNSTFLASAIYVHTNEPQDEFDIAGGSTGNPAYTAQVIGKTVSPDKPGCPWTAAHLHQFGEDFDNRNTGTYPEFVNAQAVTASSISNWINNESFTFNE